jgi:hypothetical protein
LFSGEPDPEVKLVKGFGQFEGTRLLIRKPVGWELTTDRTLGFLLSKPDGSAKLFVGEQKAGSTLTAPPQELLVYTSARNVKAEPPAKGTIGQFAIPAQIGEGTAIIADEKERGKIYYFLLEMGGARDISLIAVLRAGATPDAEKALIAAIRSIKRTSDK